MFRDDRPYRGIVFSSGTVSDITNVRNLFPRRSITAAEKPRACPKGTIHHYFYYSDAPFTRNVDLLNEAREKRDGRFQYRYNLYAIEIRTATALRVMIAVPFMKMAKEVFGLLRDAARGKKFHFDKLLLEKALESSRRGERAAALLKVTRIKYSVTADPSLESVVFVGDELAKSGCRESFLKGVADGTSIRPEAIRISLDDQFNLTTDNFGHFQFRVSKRATNLDRLPTVFNVLTQLQLLEQVSAFPHMKHFDEESEEQDE